MLPVTALTILNPFSEKPVSDDLGSSSAYLHAFSQSRCLAAPGATYSGPAAGQPGELLPVSHPLRWAE